MTVRRVLLPCLTLLMLANALSPVFGQDDAELVGDIDGDGMVTIEDIDSYCYSIATTRVEMDGVPDINADGRVDYDDMEVLLESIGILRGDVNLDGLVQFRDFVKLSSNFGRGFEDPVAEDPVFWSDGDFDCDRGVAFVDFLYLSSNYGEFGGPALIELEGVPEPAACKLAIWAGAMMLIARQRRTRVVAK